MHEFSIAEAVLDLAREHVPDGAVLEAVYVEAGPMRGIEPDAMQWAWQALTTAEAIGDVRLELTVTPWQLQCPDCGRTFIADDSTLPCTCGCRLARPFDCDQLRLTAIDVDERSRCHAGQSD